MLLTIQNNSKKDSPSISTMINQLKGCVTKQVGHPIWHTRFNDHIIRSTEDYICKWEYIDTNPQR